MVRDSPFLDGTVGFDVDYVADSVVEDASVAYDILVMRKNVLVLPQVCGEFDVAFLLEVARECILVAV